MKAARSAWSHFTARLPAPLQRHAGLALSAALLLAWALGVAWPAWQALQQAPQRLAHAQAQAQRTAALAQALAAQRQSAQTGPLSPATTEAVRSLTQQQLGAAAQLRDLESGGWDVQLQGVPAQALARWLIAVREELALRMTELELQRDGDLWHGHVRLLAGGAAR